LFYFLLTIFSQDSTDCEPILSDPSIYKSKTIYSEVKKLSNFHNKYSSTDTLAFLSTYDWKWAPYINSMKQKLYQVWQTPPAYHKLGRIYGSTKIIFEISKQGDLLNIEILEHKGHESLRESSIKAIESIFPFKPLPANFPDPSLKITAMLIYPNLREMNLK